MNENKGFANTFGRALQTPPKPPTPPRPNAQNAQKTTLPNAQNYAKAFRELWGGK